LMLSPTWLLLSLSPPAISLSLIKSPLDTGSLLLCLCHGVWALYILQLQDMNGYRLPLQYQCLSLIKISICQVLYCLSCSEQIPLGRDFSLPLFLYQSLGTLLPPTTSYYEWVWEGGFIVGFFVLWNLNFYVF